MQTFSYETPIRFDLEALKSAVVEIEQYHKSTATAINNSRKLYERLSEQVGFMGEHSAVFTTAMVGSSKGNTARIYYKPSFTQAPRKCRKAIIPTNPNNRFVYFDVTAAEFIMNAYLMGAQEVIEANAKGEDVYMVYKDLFPEGTPREFIKGSLIATMYGGTPRTIKNYVQCTDAQAQETFVKLKKALPLRDEFAARVIGRAKTTGRYWAGTLERGFENPIYISDVDFSDWKESRALSIATQSALGLWMQSLILKLGDFVQKDTTLIQVFDSVLLEVDRNIPMEEIRIELEALVAPFRIKIGEGDNYYEAQMSAK